MSQSRNFLNDIREKSLKEHASELVSLRKDLLKMRIRAKTQPGSEFSMAKSKVLKKNIARVLTVIKEKGRNN